MSDAQVVVMGKNSGLWHQWYCTSLCPGTCCSSSGLWDEVGPHCAPECCISGGLRDHFGPVCDLEHFAALTVRGTTWDLCVPEYILALVAYWTRRAFCPRTCCSYGGLWGLWDDVRPLFAPELVTVLAVCGTNWDLSVPSNMLRI